MYHIVTTITTTDEMTIYAIDYVALMLINETCELIHIVIESYVWLIYVRLANNLVVNVKYVW